MHAATSKEVAAQLSRQLANFKLGDDVIKGLADRLIIDGLAIGRINPCIYGICIDYFSDKFPQFAGLTIKQRVSRWDVFPYGIIEWDRFHVRAAFEVDELAGKGIVHGGGFGGGLAF
jgi:hypothetical protein